MIAIPQELLDQFDRGNVLLFIGERILRDAEGKRVVDGMTADLVARSGLDDNDDHTFPEAAQAYEDAQGRQALVQFVRDRFEALGDASQPVHRLIASLDGSRLMATTCMDRRLERAFADAGRPLDVIVRDVDVAFEDDRKAQLYKLRGSFERPDSLVLTDDDYERFFDEQESISVVLQGYIARKTIAFVGYDLADPHFKRLLYKVTEPLDNYARRSYAFTTSTSESISRWCKRHDVELIEVNEELFLQALAEQLTSRIRKQTPSTAPPGPAPERPSRPLPERPYKLLDYYDTSDAGLFFGREREIQTLTSLINAHRMVSLYGASGTGKTSLLLAGVSPPLEQADPPYVAVYVRLRSAAEPGAAIRNAVRRRLREIQDARLEAAGPGAQTPTGTPAAPAGAVSPVAPGSPATADPTQGLPQNGSLVDFLDVATRGIDRTLVIFLDQFEEFFTQYSPSARQAFIGELGDVYDARGLPVKVVLSFREDWLASMNEIRQRIPEIFNAGMRLLPLTRQAARQAITAPVEQLGMSYEPSLVERLLDDLTAQAQTPDSAQIGATGVVPVAVPSKAQAAGAPPAGTSPAVSPGGAAVAATVAATSPAVAPPQLQLVCNALYERARAAGRTRIIVQDYEDVGGSQGVLARYIEEALQQHPAAERPVARAILVALVTSRGARAWADLPAIRAAAGADQVALERSLDRLIVQRLVRRVDDGHAYELAHDVLAAAISGWIGDDDRRLKQARELIRRELADWQQDPAVLPSLSKFQRVDALRESLRLAPEETAFLCRAAVLYGENLPYWLSLVDGAAAQTALLLDMLAYVAPRARINAARALAGFSQDDVALALARVALDDPDPDVRDVAALSLGCMGGRLGIQELVKALALHGGERPPRALRALALIQDEAPEQVAPVAGPLRRQISTALARIRFSRDWPAIRAVSGAGALGGALAFGLGLAIPLILHESVVTFGFHVLTAIFSYVPFVASLGLVAGAILAFGVRTGAALSGRKVAAGRMVGGALGGALGFALALIPFTLGDYTGAGKVLGSILFGALVGFGIAAPAAVTEQRGLALLGGAVGGALGIALFGLFGFTPFGLGPAGDVPVAALLLCGALLGLILAYAIASAEARRAPAPAQPPAQPSQANNNPTPGSAALGKAG